jgi:hypothetical protein
MFAHLRMDAQAASPALPSSGSLAARTTAHFTISKHTGFRRP